MSDVRFFPVLITVVDDDEPSFPASVAVSESTVEIQAFDITLGSWPFGDVEAVPGDGGLLVEVPGTLMVIRTDEQEVLERCFVDRIGAQTRAS